ncbi:pyridoxamine 5'-phosphate oxidase family protein [Microlunatus sp. Gsoil 973]|uniref:pyridoxamine 5'-phosphate oxidase family protein n=1 Tax=Microlunatus sp. Gsoil 973 TaxID=2672569 RepID=UPI0012B444C9|nr:pyridoxamine 5'-phosphate oxidase family protein [Microlunatus sp. Gsoil 973]QGN35001.1 hypothetical protein GJV80_21665 [Microlunatus sp. Gsoil 973]
MTTVPHRPRTFSSTLDRHDCRALLASESVGRIGWAAGSGQIILPIAYVYAGAIIGFRTSENSRLAELCRPTRVAFEVDCLDQVRSEGDSVLVQGITRAAQDGGHQPDWADLVVPWDGGRRQLAIEINITRITGRRIRRHPESF